jgi:threonine dehydrogenase-like Zn-dependent dehydrogenase
MNDARLREVTLLPDGRVAIREEDGTSVPEPGLRQALVRVHAGAVSTGTETTMIRQLRAAPRPADSAPSRLGYSTAGVIEATGTDYAGPGPGTPVAVYGAPYVRHADRLVVGQNLIAPAHALPPEQAAFGGIGAIALHAVRMGGVELGQRVGVLGLGVVGQLVAQLARAAGAWVLAADPLPSRRDVAARMLGTGDSVVAPDAWADAAGEFSAGQGLDAVLVCAGTPDENGPALASLDAVRFRGRVVIVGNVRTDFPREPLFQKEATVLVSRAAGAGRYDAQYERDGWDMPVGLVPWTEGRNLRCFIDLLAAGRVAVEPLISEVLPVERAADAYERLIERPGETLALVLRF